jgi:exodeoxyribonuclease VII large subunit
LRDVLTTLDRRAPMIEITIYPTAVQGANAAQEIATAIDAARLRDEVDVLIVCRGGGSIEDLWSFNAEVVARAIVRFQDQTKIPVVSGVGHETDFTICDFVADQRAPTPTAAAEMVSPDAEQLRAVVLGFRTALFRTLRRTMDNAYQRVDRAQRNLLSPQDRLDRERDRLTRLTTHLQHTLRAQLDRAGFAVAMPRQRLFMHRPDIATRRQLLSQKQVDLTYAVQRTISDQRSHMQNLTKALQLLAPARVLERGYSIVEYDGAILRDSADVAAGKVIAVRLARGQLTAEVLPDK